MIYNLSYRRPAHHGNASASSLDGCQKQESINESIRSSSACSMSYGIPEALSFDRITAGGTCPPLTLRDFMNYLKYIEHDAENLQFFLWARAYIEKFNRLSTHEKSLSPEWMPLQTEVENIATQARARQMKLSPDTASALKGTGLESSPKIMEIPPTEQDNPFISRTPSSEKEPSSLIPDIKTSEWPVPGISFNGAAAAIKRKMEGAYDEAGLKWQPFTIQPFRAEVARIITIYIADGAPRQLNLSSKERVNLLHALENTTHPSAFRDVLVTVEWSLRCQAHPNFIRWSICNGNGPRVSFARGLGIGGIIGGIVVALLITLSRAGRGWRILALILFFVGIATLVAAWKGMCVVLHGMHHRHLRPWELFSDEDEDVQLKDTSMDTVNSVSTNSYEDEPWVAKYDKRNVIRKVFDRELWIEEPALRQIQDTIFLQAVLGGIAGGLVLTAIFLAVPAGDFY